MYDFVIFHAKLTKKYNYIYKVDNDDISCSNDKPSLNIKF